MDRNASKTANPATAPAITRTALVSLAWILFTISPSSSGTATVTTASSAVAIMKMVSSRRYGRA